MTAGECFEALVRLQERLLGSGGCPWDREQTHESLRTYLIEEAYEVLEALDAQDFKKLPEEFGDLLLQVVFHAELARREGLFEIRDVIERIHTKLVRRHPHVFGEVKAKDSATVLKNWEQLKAAERAEMNGIGEPRGQQAESLLDGVPKSLPALLEAYQLTKRAARIGFDWDDIEGVLEKLREEATELRETLSPDAAAAVQARREEEVGDLLFVAANVARFLKVDPEVALKRANRKFAARFRSMEAEMRRRGSQLADASREEMERLWEASKNGSKEVRK
jgi:tetrapyrrole methylase family protein/MazG family protein